MTAKAKAKKKLVALSTSKLTTTQIIANAQHYVGQMTGNAHFPTPNPALALITTQADATQKAYDTSLTRIRGSAGIMHTELKKLTIDLKLLAAYVENVANADPDNAESIINQAGMMVKKPSVRKPKTFSADPGKAPGSVLLNTKAEKGGVYLYEMTTDPNTASSWTVISTDNKVKFTKTGLSSGIRYYFRVAVVVKSVQGSWSPVLNVIIS
jgi:hypothetical protein